jgi:wyosine [tRNA(Phe)-imidazoG37] synthetase (radical SAM superfamily)
MRLTTTDHDRGGAGLDYVYPVLSRRSGGVSVGINLNPNNACNWRCVYCQVPGLVLGAGPEIDLGRLEGELRELLGRVLRGEFLEPRAASGGRELSDVAFSGNGEPTSSPQFAEAVERAGAVLIELGLRGRVPLVLITNGSLVHRPSVQRGLSRMAELGGEVWFKLDSATAEGTARINSSRIDPARVRDHLELAARACPTWIQTLVFDWNGPSLDGTEEARYLERIEELVRSRVPLRGVLLYGLARTSQQPEAGELAALPREWLEAFAARIEAAGLPVRVSV